MCVHHPKSNLLHHHIFDPLLVATAKGIAFFISFSKFHC